MLRSGAKLYDGSAATYRKTWNTLMKAFQIPMSKYTPASLRGGGCCHAYEQDSRISNLMWRLASMATLKHYLQEVVATASLISLPPETRHDLHAAAKSFDIPHGRIASKTCTAGTSTSLEVVASAASAYTRGKSSGPPTRP